MATEIDSKGNEFLVRVSKPESGWIRDLAHTMGITRDAVVGAALNKGLTHYVTAFCHKDRPTKIGFNDNGLPDIS